MAASPHPYQPSLDELGVPLHEVTFVIVDLETTGGSPQHSRVTEVGAVKVRGGELLGELQTLVDPGVRIPASISALTGITDGLVAGHPPLEAVLPAFVEFSHGATLVAHNARFDTAFLNAGLRRLDYPPLPNPVVCTAALARRLVRDEVRNCKLATLAQHFRCQTEPVHRALADARATVEVLHALLERAGTFGVMTLEDLVAFAKVRNTPLFKARRSLADGLPGAPGVYAFRSASGEVLYVGKATDLRARVRSYFGQDDRRKITDLLKEAEQVEHTVCPTPIEAAVREVRAIHEHRPRFNRRSKHPNRQVWLKLTTERFPRLSVVRAVRADGGTYLGPLPAKRVAEQVAEAIHEVLPIRRCTDRIGPRTCFSPCALAEMGRCLAPCDGRIEPAEYESTAALVRAVLGGAPEPALGRLTARMRALADAGRFEEAAATRDRMRTLAEALARARRRAWCSGSAELVAARPGRGGQHEVVLVRHGRLVASTTCAATEITAASARLRRDARLAHDDQALPPAPADEEVELLARWLEGRGVRIVHSAGQLAGPALGGQQVHETIAACGAARRSTGDSAVELAAKRTRRASGDVTAITATTGRPEVAAALP
jgi:DNA polymerase III subunit epsilon